MAEALLRPRLVELPGGERSAAANRATTKPGSRATEARRPVHLAVVVGLSASAYAVSLAGVTSLQADTNRDLAAANAPAVDALATLTAEHDRLEARLASAGAAYSTTAAAYSDITDELARLEDRLGKLAGQVAKVQGSASWVAPSVRLPSVSRSAPRASRPASNGSTGASGH